MPGVYEKLVEVASLHGTFEWFGNLYLKSGFKTGWIYEFIYDTEGSRLFEAITKLPEYYPTRTELACERAYTGRRADGQ